MPELPEVETCRAGLSALLLGKTFAEIVVRESKLRWPIPDALNMVLTGNAILSIERRAKYLLITCCTGTLILHLGMSGRLHVYNSEIPAGKHDHIDFIFTDNSLLRFNDPRKFGAVLWCDSDINQHPLLLKLGPEPLTAQFNGDYLFGKAQTRKLPVKSLIMDSHIVVGVGNIYASESLFIAAIHPNRPAGEISLAEYQALVSAIKLVLNNAIAMGGTTLRDFSNPEGRPGYFQQALNVYGRAKLACVNCSQTIQLIKISNRSSFFCPTCQR